MLPSTMVQQKLLKNLTSCVKFWGGGDDVMEIGEYQYMLMEQLKEFKHKFNE